MTTKPVHQLPATSQWFTRVTRSKAARVAERQEDRVCIGVVDTVKEQIEVMRFDGFFGGGFYTFGRKTWVSFATWRAEGRNYTPVDAPQPEAQAPVHEILASMVDEGRSKPVEAPPESGVEGRTVTTERTDREILLAVAATQSTLACTYSALLRNTEAIMRKLGISGTLPLPFHKAAAIDKAA